MHILEQAGGPGLASHLRRLSDRLVQDGIRIYRQAGIEFEPRWFPVYFYLCRAGPSAVTEIARGLGVTHPLVNQMSKELIASNLVAAYRDARDKRRRVLALTSQGKSLLPALEKIWRDMDLALQSVLDEAGASRLPASLLQVERLLAERRLYDRFSERDQSD